MRRLIIELIGATPPTAGERRARLRALLGLEEVWARSYAQYIVSQSGAPELQLELDAARAPVPGRVYYPLQWADDDFQPIGQAIDTLFRRLGWRDARTS